MSREAYVYTDEHGVKHVYRSFLNRHCDAHKRECWPWTPVAAADLLAPAAKDETLDDGAFVKLRQAVDGDPSGPTD